MEIDLLDTIRHRINAGDREGARLELAELLETDPDNADGWALFAVVVADPAEKAECYRQILRLDPENRLATAWLEALAPQAPAFSDREEVPRQEGTDLQCEECGALAQVRSVGPLREKRVVCPFCGAERDLPDTIRREERVREREDAPEGGSQAIESIRPESRGEQAPEAGGTPAADELERLMNELRLSVLDEDTLKELGESGLDGLSSEQVVASPAPQVEKRSVIDRLFGRRREEETLNLDAVGDLEGQLDALAQTGRLGPGDIIRLAGGPLPARDRRKCPGCGAVVSRNAAKCPWCSAPLPHVGDE